MRLSNIAIYDKSTIDFYNQGLGILSDAISSESTEAVQDNGNITYEMTLKYPINGVLADKLKLPNLIRAQESEDPNDFMIFEIYDYDEDDDGEMTVYAQALPYRVLRLPFNDEAKFATKYNDVQELFDDAIKRVTGFPTWFKINSDVKLASNLNFKNSQFENLGKLLEATMSLIDATVEYQWNQINILQSRGRDLSNIVLRDDKNTNGVKITGSYEKIINKVVPIIKNRNETTGEFEDGTHMGSVVTSKDPFKWIPYYAGVTAAFDSQEEANNYISSNKLDNPAITVDVTPLMVDEDLTQVHTFDRITAYSTKLKYQDTLQVTTRVFDQLNAEVVSFKMGSIKKDINSTTSYTLSSLASEIARAQNIARVAARSADGKNTNYYAEAIPADPIEGDLWFHKIDGKDIMQQYINGEWTTIVKDGMGEEIQAYVDQKMLENDEVLAGLNTKLQDNDKALAGLNTKLQDNDEAMDKLHTDLESNTQIIKDNKQAIDDAMGKVNENLAQAQSDVKKAVSDADQAVANAKSSADASGFATQTANAASDAALAAKNLATSTANSFATVKTQADQAVTDANTAKANAAQAINDAAAAKGQAANALGQAGTAIDNAANALDKFNNLNIGGRNLLSNSRGKFKPNTSRTDNYSIYTNSAVYMTQGQQYTVHADASYGLVWSGTHDGSVENNNVVLWLVDNAKVNTIISDANTGTGTTFTWNGPSGTYYLRVNTYKPDNSGYVENVKIEKGNVATDWSPAPEDVQQQFTNIDGELASKISQTTYNTLAGTVDTVNTLAKKNQSTISTLATSASVDAVSGRVTKAQSLAEQTANGLTFKADKSVVGTIDGTVKQQGIDLKAAQGELKLKITQSDFTKGLSGYATQTWAQNKITATATGLETKLSSVTQRLNTDDRPNLITGSLQNLNNWVKNSIAQDAIKNNVFVNGTNTMTYQGVSDTEIISATLPTVAGNSYVVSIDFTGPNFTVLTGYGWGPAIDFGTDQDHFAMLEPGANEKRYVFRFAASGNDTLYLRFGNVADGASNTFVFANLSVQLDAVSQVTATEMSTLSQTIDGLSATFAKKTDLATTASNLKVTADGLNLLTTATGKKGEKVTQVISDVNNIKSTMTGANGVTTRLQTLEGFKQTATSQLNGKASQSQVTQLAGQVTSVVQSAGRQNLVYNSEFNSSGTGWTGLNSTCYISDVIWTPEDYGAGLVFNVTTGAATMWHRAYSKPVPISAQAVYSLSCRICKDKSEYATFVSIEFLNANGARTSIKDASPNMNDYGKFTTFKRENVKPDALATQVRVLIQLHGNGHAKWQHPMLVVGNTVGPYQQDTVSSSQFTQLSDNVNLRVKKGDVINQINISPESILIAGQKVHITGQTTIDNASIQSAAIANLDAAKITSGSISSDRLVTTKLNADNITSGSIAAARIATTALSATNITSGTFDASKMTVKNINAGSITSGSIATERLATTKLNADNITSGSIATERLATTKLNASNITSGTIDAGNINVVNLNASNITSGTITGIDIISQNAQQRVEMYNGTVSVTDGVTSTNLSSSGFINHRTIDTYYLSFVSQGMSIKADSANTGLARNAGLELYGDTSYIDFHDSVSATNDYGARIGFSEGRGNKALRLYNPSGNIEIRSKKDKPINLQGASVNIRNDNNTGWVAAYASTFSSQSAHSLKENFQLIDDNRLLQAVTSTDIVGYNFKGSSQRYCSFVINDDGLSPYYTDPVLIDDGGTSFNSTTATGVMMGAIKALNGKLNDLNAKYEAVVNYNSYLLNSMEEPK